MFNVFQGKKEKTTSAEKHLSEMSFIVEGRRSTTERGSSGTRMRMKKKQGKTIAADTTKQRSTHIEEKEAAK
jgi:hypothetical protein